MGNQIAGKTMPAGTSAESLSHKIYRLVVNNILYILVFIAFIALALSSKYFLTVNNIISLLRDASPVMLVAIGCTFTLTSKQMDLSVGAIVLTSASVGGLLIDRLGVHSYAGLICMILTGLCCGMLNGFLIVVVQLNPWLVTLGTQLALKGLSYTFTYADTIRLPAEFKFLRSLNIAGVPLYLLFALCMFVVFHLVMTRTIYGRSVIAIGTNVDSAKKIGINVGKIKFMVYSITGFLCGLAACMATINMTAVTRDSGKSYEFLAVAMAVLGGCSMSGGSSKILPGTLIGVLIMALLENGLAINGLDPYFFPIFRGIIILTGMLLDAQKVKAVE